MIRIASTFAVFTLVVVVSGVNATAGPRSRQPAAAPRGLAPGIFLSIDECHVESAREVDGLIEAHVTLSNNGATPVKVDYSTFSLSSAAGGRSLALLPSELNGRVAPPLLLREGLLEKGQTMRAVLYFRSPSSDRRSIDLRVDLAAADGRLISRSFLPLVLN